MTWRAHIDDVASTRRPAPPSSWSLQLRAVLPRGEPGSHSTVPCMPMCTTALAFTQGLTLVHFSAQPVPFWSHLPVSPCLIDWGKIMHPTYPTKCAYVEARSGRV